MEERSVDGRSNYSKWLLFDELPEIAMYAFYEITGKKGIPANATLSAKTMLAVLNADVPTRPYTFATQ